MLVLSAKRRELPKQKPNKKRATQGVFHSLRRNTMIAGRIWDGGARKEMQKVNCKMQN
jgi:hypothetical protein